VLEDAPSIGLEWGRGELAVWLRRLGVDVRPAAVAPPYAALIAGEWDAAVALFREVPLPYDAALVEIDADHRTDRARAALDALDTLDRFGADAVAAKLRQQLRSSGHAGVPGPPRRVTRTNPLGLTPRQMEVLRALSDGSTNAELAARLYVSEKTVDHHVSAILTKLGVANRREAARRARELGILASDGALPALSGSTPLVSPLEDSPAP
jgi:DNA-binding CsgD family transcriptional regulator